MKEKNAQIQALRVLKQDAGIVQVRRALKELYGVEINQIAKDLGCSRQYVTLAIQGYRTNTGLQQAIADYWGVPREEIFPDGSATR